MQHRKSQTISKCAFHFPFGCVSWDGCNAKWHSLKKSSFSQQDLSKWSQIFVSASWFNFDKSQVFWLDHLRSHVISCIQHVPNHSSSRQKSSWWCSVTKYLILVNVTWRYLKLASFTIIIILIILLLLSLLVVAVIATKPDLIERCLSRHSRSLYRKTHI